MSTQSDNASEIRTLMLFTNARLNEYVDFHDTIFAAQGTLFSVVTTAVKRLLGGGRRIPFAEFAEDSAELARDWEHFTEATRAFRDATGVSGFTPAQCYYVDLLLEYTVAVSNAVHILAERQRGLLAKRETGKDSGFTKSVYLEIEQRYRDACRHYAELGAELDKLSPAMLTEK